jgi:hypothetical protein
VGHTVGSNERTPIFDKIEAIRQIPEPTTKKMLRSFLGSCNFYRGYIPHFADTAFPLTELTKAATKNKIKFNEEQREAFEMLKIKLGEATTLVTPDITRPFVLHTDSSDYAVGGVLSQYHPETNTLFPIAFVSSKLSPTQRNYSTIEKESYAVIYALDKLDHLLHNAEILLYVDHNPLKYITMCAPSSPKLTRWSLSLARYKIITHHVKGKDNHVADFLSRCYQ